MVAFWGRFFQRLLRSTVLLLCVLTSVFALLRAVPGGPFDGERELPPEATAALQAHYGTDKSFLRSYFRYVGRTVRGDLGPSFRQLGWSVNELLADKARASFELGAYAFLLAILLGVPWGCWAAFYPDKFFCRTSMSAATVLICIPSFALGPLLCQIFSLRLHWLRVMGWSGWRCKVLPTITLGLIQAAFLARLTRRSLACEFARPYVRTARAKGLSEGAIFWKHVFRNGIGPIIAYVGPICAALLSGTFAVENIFHIPGLGRLFIESIGNRDYGVVTGIVLLYSLLILICNFFADTLLAAIGPRSGSG